MFYSADGNVQTAPEKLKGDVEITVASGSSINVADYFSCVLATESQDVDIVAVLLTMSDTKYIIQPMIIEDITSELTFYIGYARTKSGLGVEAGLEVVEHLYVVTIKIASTVE